MESARVIEQLIDMAKKSHATARRGEERGLTKEEIRFDDALANNASAVRAWTDEARKQMARARTENLRHTIAVDWSARERVWAKLWRMVERILRPYKSPPDQQDGALEWGLQQVQAQGEAGV